MTELYCGMDLHSMNTYIGILDNKFKRRFEKRVKNCIEEILEILEPYREDLRGIVVESTYNWYWLVDGLMDAQYEVHLANPAAIKQFEGKKYTDDRHDAFWLAQLLALDILPTGYIYPKEQRPVRDLLRKRSFFVRHRTSHLLSLRSMIERSTSKHLSRLEIFKLSEKDLERLLHSEFTVCSALSELSIIKELNVQINTIEKKVRHVAQIQEPFHLLKSIPGVGNILAMTVMFEVGTIDRFPTVGDFCSYCRCVPSKRISSGKKKGEGNRKNGNRYLSWAFIEIAHFAKRYSERVRKYHARKRSLTNPAIAAKAVGNKICRAVYYMLRDRVIFKEEGLYCGFSPEQQTRTPGG